MSASERLPRLLALVPWLSAHDGVTIAQAAEHFGVTPEQLEKDLWQLIVCGVPGYGPDQLVDIQFWDDDVIHVLDPQTLDRPLRLTFEEATALLVALRVLAQTPGVDDRAAILSAAAKIEAAAMPPDQSGTVAVSVGVDPDIRAAVDTALASGGALRITYASAARDELSERTVQPLGLLVVDDLVYLDAYCLSAPGRRTFRLDRVLAAGPAPAPALDVDADQPATAPPPLEAVLDVAPEARWIIDVHGAVELQAAAAGWTRVRLALHSQDWAVRLVLGLGGRARVVEPAELRQAVAQSAAAALQAYA